jgi:hypothetical protein
MLHDVVNGIEQQAVQHPLCPPHMCAGLHLSVALLSRKAHCRGLKGVLQGVLDLFRLGSTIPMLTCRI